MSCEGALLLVDASQGVEAQTVANLYLALEYDLEIMPVINKIDLPVGRRRPGAARRSRRTSASTRPTPCSCSAKTGTGIDDVLEAIVEQAAAARRATPTAPLQALIFDAQYDPYRGVVLLRAASSEGTLRAGDRRSA